MSEGCLLEGHRRQIAAMDVAKTLGDAASERSNVFCLGFASLTILTSLIADVLALSK
ncbi:hypothetical protein CEV34_4092 [Brucella pseudogrignonensis]|uniref:Uncharacterized protein n=1 Tax=Brucella pseudogrignonensis TaxID=419475 RepID=A0A256G745_9HYPH|nr:hypothetical protein CEV34_4092 [Brucella pseudogrignonensis]